jgi:hypothetical protein
MTVVGVEGMAWYRHEQTVEANGLATGRTWPPVASIDSPEAESRLARGEWWFHLTRASLDLDQENQFAEGQVKSDRLLGREFEERSRQRGAAVPESQSLSYEIDSEGFKVVADRLVEEAGVEPMLHRFRDTRKIDAVYNMTENDVREQARFDDSIGIYPEFIDDYGILILPTTGRYFQLPYRNLLPKKVSNPRWLEGQLAAIGSATPPHGICRAVR